MRPWLSLLTILLLPAAASAAPRFFLAGNGHLLLQNAHFHATLDVRYRRRDGSYDPAALVRINHFFRSREDGKEEPISLRLIELLSYVQQRFRPGRMILVSGYRSPQFNSDLRAAGDAVARASLHTEAMAADVDFPDASMRKLWHQLRALHAGGAGYYRKNKFLHIDTGRPRFWEEATSRVDEDLAAGNARVFARTDFDRYSRIDGAIVSLHSVTALPLLLAPRAELVGGGDVLRLQLEPVGADVEMRGGCLAIDRGAQAYRLRVSSPASPEAMRHRRGRVVLSTCEPRVGKTPVHIESNIIEIGVP
jgi:uncharacterized protein YcbK (DUF882 family)